MYRRFMIPILVIVFTASAFTAFAAAAKKPVPTKKTSVSTNTSIVAAKPVNSHPKKAEKVKHLPKLIDLGADKCIPCKMMFTVLDELKKDYKGKLAVEFIDVWKNPSAGEKYKVRMIPTQVFYDGEGKEVYRHLGYFPKEDIIAAFKKHGIKL